MLDEDTLNRLVDDCERMCRDTAYPLAARQAAMNLGVEATKMKLVMGLHADDFQRIDEERQLGM